MGNDHSQMKGLEIDSQSVEVTDFWTLYSGELPNAEGKVSLISLFQGEAVVNGQLWTNQLPLERATKNFMIYRHPSILKFISSWERGSQKFLVTERCKPLTLDIASQSQVQICLGLRNVLCSLIFLVEQGNARHLNIGSSSIYVTQDGAWRMAGFEHLWKSKEVNTTLLERSQPFRYRSAIDPNELQQSGAALEEYAFAVLCEEILKSHNKDFMPHVAEFKEYCSTHLKHKTVALRPKLSAVLLHPYFNHEFVVIHSFLTELPLKSQPDKQQFFTSLVDRLRDFDETNVAIQMADLLLSRMVLLDPTAQMCLTPFILKPRTDDMFPALFAPATFTTYIVPKILQIFGVRDAQIRLILLEYFTSYMKLFSLDGLKDQLLPQLLLGIKDTNDILVAATLRCLADLVPVLGAAVVVGRNRGRLFADGRPQGLPDISTHWIEHRSITPVMNAADLSSGSPLLDHVDISGSYESPNRTRLMPERLSPDGGEDVKTTSEVMELEDDAWSDWETDNVDGMASGVKLNDELSLASGVASTNDVMATAVPLLKRQSSSGIVENFIIDVKELDIKIIPQTTEEIDFFKDMEPVIHKASVMLIADKDSELSTQPISPIIEVAQHDAAEKNVHDDKVVNVDQSRFEIKASVNDDDAVTETGWDDESNDWDDG